MEHTTKHENGSLVNTVTITIPPEAVRAEIKGHEFAIQNARENGHVLDKSLAQLQQPGIFTAEQRRIVRTLRHDLGVIQVGLDSLEQGVRDNGYAAAAVLHKQGVVKGATVSVTKQTAEYTPTKLCGVL